MIRARMSSWPRPLVSRFVRPLALILAAGALAAVTAACGTERIKVPHNSPYYEGALIFSEHCSGCHTLSAAGTRGSPANIRDATAISGPDFDQRCERPVTRVLYAIENGGFSGAYMPQNVVVGEQARQVAEFVAHYAGSQAVFQPGVPGAKPCKDTPIGTLPPATSAGLPILSSSTSGGGGSTASASSAASSTGTSASTTSTTASTSAGVYGMSSLGKKRGSTHRAGSRTRPRKA
jgi:mono/diheme cytochrome c family protein